MSRTTFIAVVALAFAPRLVPAQQLEFQQANQLYQQGDYAEAVRAYSDILQNGYESAELYYNLGNAHFKLGELGHAILNYERSRRLDPRDEDVKANLELARSLTTDDITPLPDFLPMVAARAWVNLLPQPILRILTAVFYSATLLLAGAGLLLSGRWFRRLTWAGGIATVLLSINLFLREMGFIYPDQAIVMSESASVMSAPSRDPGLQLFTIHEGTLVRIDQAGQEWSEIVLEDGRVGWVESETIEDI